MYSSHAVENDPPSHIGSSYILPSMMTSSEGQTIVPITSNKHHPIGQLQC
jgi:glycerophosphocholine phosphodiesterase GPCPD1